MAQAKIPGFEEEKEDITLDPKYQDLVKSYAEKFSFDRYLSADLAGSINVYRSEKYNNPTFFEIQEICQALLLFPYKVKQYPIRTYNELYTLDPESTDDLIFDVLVEKHPEFAKADAKGIIGVLEKECPDLLVQASECMTGLLLLKVLDQSVRTLPREIDLRETAKELVKKYSCGHEDKLEGAVPPYTAWNKIATFDSYIEKYLREHAQCEEYAKQIDRIYDYKEIWNGILIQSGFSEGVEAYNMFETPYATVLDVAKALGIDSSIEAYCNGVPVDDILV